MKGRIRVAALLIMPILLSSIPASDEKLVVHASSTQQQLNQVQQEMSELEDKLEETNEDLEDLKDSHSSLKGELNNLNEKLS